MIKAIIVDDERSVRFAINQQADWKRAGVIVVAQASNGIEGMEKTLELKPDLVITDMKMPGMDGTEMMEALKKKMPHLKFIVISGYDDFAYMKSAISARVNDYILKPIDEMQLNEALFSAAEEIRAERDQLVLDRHKAVRLDQAIRLHRDKLLNKLVFPSPVFTEDERGALAEVFGRGDRTYHAVAFHMATMRAVLGKQYYNDIDTLSFGVVNVIEESLESDAVAVFRELSAPNRFCAIMRRGGPGRRSDLEKARDNLLQFLGLQCIIGVGSDVGDFMVIHLTYANACKRFMRGNFFGDYRICTSEPPVNTAGAHLPEYLSCEKELLAAVESGNHTQLKHCVDKLLQKLTERAFLSPEQLKTLYGDILTSVEKTMEKLRIESVPPMNNSHSADAFIDLAFESGYQVQSLSRYVCDALSVYIDSVRVSRRMKSKDILYSIKEYIDHFYYEEISLETISNRFFINRSYLSRRFKEEFRYNLTDYVNEVRLKKAEDLIKEGKFKLIEVMSLTGFNSPNYFGKVFKKRFGITPSEMKATETKRGDG